VLTDWLDGVDEATRGNPVKTAPCEKRVEPHVSWGETTRVDGGRRKEDFSRVPYTYPYPRPAVTADVVAFAMRADDLAVLLIRRKDEPFKGAWALPGGFVDENESLERAAARELYEETGLTGLRMEQLGAFGDPGRDPRGHTVTVAYVSFLMTEKKITAGDDATAAEWKSFRALTLEDAQVRSVPPPPLRRGRVKTASPKLPSVRLAFDHAKIITKAYRRLWKHLDDPVRDTAFDLVPPRFTLSQLKRICEVILGRPVTPAMLRKHFVDRGLAVPATTKPAPRASEQLYRWNRR
jgi:8-oxo-dGTP diphosphatase